VVRQREAAAQAVAAGVGVEVRQVAAARQVAWPLPPAEVSVASRSG
jgi:hypothetical protein